MKIPDGNYYIDPNNKIFRMSDMSGKDYGDQIKNWTELVNSLNILPCTGTIVHVKKFGKYIFIRPSWNMYILHYLPEGVI